MSSTLGVVLTVLAGLGGFAGLASVLKAVFDRTKIRADALDQVADTSVKLLAPLHSEIDRLSAKLRAAEQEVDDLRKQMRQMAIHSEEIGALQTKLRANEQELDTSRNQIRDLYREIDRRDRDIADRDRELNRLRSSGV